MSTHDLQTWRADYAREFGAAFPGSALPDLTDDVVRGLIEAGVTAGELCAEVRLGLAAEDLITDAATGA